MMEAMKDVKETAETKAETASREKVVEPTEKPEETAKEEMSEAPAAERGALSSAPSASMIETPMTGTMAEFLKIMSRRARANAEAKEHRIETQGHECAEESEESAAKRPRLSEGRLVYSAINVREVAVTLPDVNGKAVDFLNLVMPSKRFSIVQFFKGDDRRNEVVYRFAPSASEQNQTPIGPQDGKAEGWRLNIKLDPEQASFVRAMDDVVLKAIQKNRGAIFDSRTSEAQVHGNYNSALRFLGVKDFMLDISTRLALKEGAEVKPTEWRIIDETAKVDRVVSDFKVLREEILPMYRHFQGAEARVFLRPNIWVAKSHCGLEWTAEAVLLWCSRDDGAFGSLADVPIRGL